MSAVRSETREKRERRRATFATIVIRITLLLHLPIAIAWTGLAQWLGLPWPAFFGGVAAALAVLPLRGRMRGMMWDRPKSNVERLLVDEPYFVHWCAAFGAAAPIALLTIAKVLSDVVRREPIRLPTMGALAVYLFFLCVAAYGVVVRRRVVVVKRVDVPIRDLPDAFDGYRIAQLSDLHIGGLTPREVGERWVRLANAEHPDLVAVTGDLVTSGVAFHEDIADVVAQLRGKDGVVVALGNHDYFGEGEPLVEKIRGRGVTVLRNDALRIAKGAASLRVAAVDDTWTGRADLERTLARHRGAGPTVVLAHDPDLFDDAARLGADLVLSGHTHGGQVAIPFFVRHANLSKLRHERTYGVYSEGDSTLYVHGGLGTTGPPIRLGVAPEVVILTLRKRALAA